MRNTLAVALLLLLCGLCFGQSSYKGLTPGKSTRADVERVLGRPVSKVSETLIEYRAQLLTGKIYVQYRKDSPIVERIEVLCRLESSNCNDFAKSLNLRLPEDPETAKVPETGEKYVFYYGRPLYVVTTIDDESFANNEVVPVRIAFYSPELYEEAGRGARKANESAIAKANEPCGKSGSSAARYHHVAFAARLQTSQFEGCVSVQKADGSQAAPSPAATIDIYRTDPPSRFNTKTDRTGRFIFAGLPISGTFLVVVSGPGLKWTYVNGIRLPPAAPLVIVAEPGDGVRPTEAEVRAVIR